MVKCHNCSYTGDVTDFESVTKTIADKIGIEVSLTCPKCNHKHEL